MIYDKTMAFNHYAKIKRILESEPDGWYVRRINEPTEALNFKGETVRYDHYYRLYRADGSQIKYGKFQKLDKFATTLRIPVEALPVVEQA
jgi:hypothetical protein